MNIKKSILVRVRIVFLFVGIIAFFIVYRIVLLQWIQGEQWRKKAKENMLEYRVVKATRGNIYSDNGSLLATSLPLYRVAFDPMAADKEVFNNSIDSLSLLLSRFFKDKSPAEYKRKIKDARSAKRRYIYLNRGFKIDYQKKKIMEQWPIFREGRMRGGVIFEKAERRLMPFKTLAMRTVGSLNENNGGAGLEYSYNNKLAGVNGESLFRRMAGGYWKPVYDGTEVKPVEGLDIQTTIDINLQDVAETALQNALIKNRASNGCVLVMEVATGEIKAIANLGINSKGEYVEGYNYAVATRADPGSTFKLASYMALLEDKKISPTDTIDTGQGKFSFYERVMTDAKPGGYGVLSLQDAFAKSSNIAISKLIQRHYGTTPQLFLQHLADFGLTTPLGFQMLGEAHPFVKTPSDPTWSGTSLPWMSVGYEVLLTPLQMLTFYNAVANNGKMIQPIIVKEVKRADEVVEKFQPKILRDKICSDETLDVLRKMLEEVVEHGTASNIRNAEYKIAGKTGTAQMIQNGKYIQRYKTSFAGYFPAQRPKYSCIVVIDNPQGWQQYGSDVAAPVFKEVADKVYARDVEMHKRLPLEPSQEQSAFPLIQAGNFYDLNFLCNAFGISNHVGGEVVDDWVKSDLLNNAVIWKNNEIRSGFVPDVRGLTLKDALYLIENAGFRAGFSGLGRVATQSLMPGMRASKGSTINLELR